MVRLEEQALSLIGDIVSCFRDATPCEKIKNGVAFLIFLGVLFLTVSVIILGRNGGKIIWSQKKWTKK